MVEKLVAIPSLLRHSGTLPQPAQEATSPIANGLWPGLLSAHNEAGPVQNDPIPKQQDVHLLPGEPRLDRFRNPCAKSCTPTWLPSIRYVRVHGNRSRRVHLTDVALTSFWSTYHVAMWLVCAQA